MGLIKKAGGARKTYAYHLAILGGAILVLVIGGLVRGGKSGERPEDATETSAIEALRREVSGVQNALRRNELEAIRATVSDATRTVAPSVVALIPRLETIEAPRRIELYEAPGDAPLTPASPADSQTTSGLLLDSTGYILTSARVSQYEFPIQAVFSAARLTADLVATDRLRNLSLLKLRDVPDVLVPANSANVADLSAGEWLVAQSRSASGATITSMHVLESVQLTSDRMPVGFLTGITESSLMEGATLVNAYGQIAGLFLDAPENNGYVLPFQEAYELAQSMKVASLGPKRGWSGLQLQDLTSDMRDYFGVENGVLVSSLVPEGPAEKAGLRVRDLIQRVNDEEVYSPRRVLEIVAQNPPGAQLNVSILRGGDMMTLEVMLSEEPRIAAASPPAGGGLVLELGPATGPDPGVAIQSVQPHSIANSIGIKAGDVIRTVEGNPIGTVNQFWTVQRRIPTDKLQLWRVSRGKDEFFVTVRERVNRQ